MNPLKKWFRLAQNRFVTFIGDIGWFGWNHPFWLVFNMREPLMNGHHYNQVKQVLKAGDILLRRDDRFIDSYLIPGWMTHGGLYIGGPNDEVIHAISDGVVSETLVDFMRTDHFIIMRAPANLVAEALRRAKSVVGREYDFGFNFNDHEKFSCTELVDYCYPNVIEPKKRFGRSTVVGDDIAECSKLTCVWDSRKDASSVEKQQLLLARSPSKRTKA